MLENEGLRISLNESSDDLVMHEIKLLLTCELQLEASCLLRVQQF